MGKILQTAKFCKKLKAQKVHVFFTQRTATQKHANTKQQSSSAGHGAVTMLLTLEQTTTHPSTHPSNKRRKVLVPPFSRTELVSHAWIRSGWSDSI
jgi:hypothetical protein